MKLHHYLYVFSKWVVKVDRKEMNGITLSYRDP